MFLVNSDDIAVYLSNKGGFFTGYTEASDEESGMVDTRNIHDMLHLVSYTIEETGKPAPYKEVLVDSISMYINRTYIEFTYMNKETLSLDKYKELLSNYAQKIDSGFFYRENVIDAFSKK